jgi:hypothetical protein
VKKFNDFSYAKSTNLTCLMWFGFDKKNRSNDCSESAATRTVVDFPLYLISSALDSKWFGSWQEVL